MGEAKPGGQEVSMECSEKDRISRFRIFPAGRQLRLPGRRRLPEGKMQLAGSKDGGWVYTIGASGI
jgi:hypothetical protein